MLEKIKSASVPDKFSQDFVAETLAMKGGTARATIPFIKKMGLVQTDGTPTDRYKEFRNPAKSGNAVAAAMSDMYYTLFEMNENVHKLDNSKLKGLIVEATGAEANSPAVARTVSTFNTLKSIAMFDTPMNTASKPDVAAPVITAQQIVPSRENHEQGGHAVEGINLAYTINLNLPATNDIEVFNAIFKSLKQHLLQE
jgi:hypothetical protein